MSKWPRIVIPGQPHHVTHRGTRRQTIFFGDDDCRLYQHILGLSCSKHGVEIWAYCLMPNHIHMIAVPERADSLSLAFGRAHQCYARIINSRNEWTGHLWEQRFSSIPMDEPHLLMAARYVELNPVRAGMVSRPSNYPYSSATPHLLGQNDNLVNVSRLLEIVPHWADFLADGLQESDADRLRELEKTGYPAGSDQFLKNIETQFGVQCRPQKRGRKPNIN